MWKAGGLGASSSSQEACCRVGHPPRKEVSPDIPSEPPWCSFEPFQHVLSLDTREKSSAPPSPPPLLRKLQRSLRCPLRLLFSKRTNIKTTAWLSFSFSEAGNACELKELQGSGLLHALRFQGLAARLLTLRLSLPQLATSPAPRAAALPRATARPAETRRWCCTPAAAWPAARPASTPGTASAPVNTPLLLHCKQFKKRSTERESIFHLAARQL